MPSRKSRLTATSLVEEWLRWHKNGEETADIAAALQVNGLNYSQILAALDHLQKVGVVESVELEEVKIQRRRIRLWALVDNPEQHDKRGRKLVERAVEEPGSRKRKAGYKRKPAA